MIPISDRKYNPDFKNTNSNKAIVILKRELRIRRTWFGVMIAIIGIYLSAHNIGSICNGSIGWVTSYLVFFICLIVIVLGGWIIFLANDGREWVTKH